MNWDKLIEEVKIDENFRSTPYCDTCGKPFRKCICKPYLKGSLTVGYGWNLEASPMTEKEGECLLTNRLNEAYDDMSRFFSDMWASLSDNRQRVLVNMRFNLGPTRFRTFVKTITAIREGRYEDAAINMLASRWAKQVGQRAIYLARLMREG